MKALAGAFGFLTVLPLPARLTGDAAPLRRAVPFFPLVGLVIGVVVAGLDAGLTRCFPVPVATVLAVVALLAVSGGLHLDGLADTADGFLSSRPRERVLEIMKDSRSGPMGVAAVVCVIALKLAVIGTLAPTQRWGALLLTPLAGRSAIVLAMAVLRYARTDGGIGSAFASGRPWAPAVAALVILGLAGWWVAGARGLAVAVACLMVTLLLIVLSWRRIGGWTGDTLGATCEIVETVPAMVLVGHV